MGISKDDVVVILRDNLKNITADIINGIVYIESVNESDFKRACRILKKAGYTDSFGWKKRNESTDNVSQT